MTSTFLSDLIRDYLAHADSVATGVPGNDVLKKQSLSDTRLAKPPRLLVAVEPDPEKKHASKIVFVCAIVITAEIVKDARATIEGWMTSVRNRIEWGHADPKVRKDGVPFATFNQWVLANRTEEQRAGWRFVKGRLFASEEDYSADDDTKTYSLSVPLRFTVHLMH